MSNQLAIDLMKEFARSTGLTGQAPSRRYLWTDAFAVCNFLGIYRQTHDHAFLDLAVELANQVHHVLGRHRSDDPRSGWISGLSEQEGERHPTRGGLRIGKKLTERPQDELLNQRLEWDRDGQYYHYLTKWMHALHRMGCETGEARYQTWAAELAVTAQRSFTRESFPGGPKRMVWKMSIDLSRPLVPSMGQHDPLDGLVTCLELQSSENFKAKKDIDLESAIAELTEMSTQGNWVTDDPLGIGGLLDNASRLAQIVFDRGGERRGLLRKILVDTGSSLSVLSWSPLLINPAERRLAFRELGLSIGFYGLERVTGIVARDSELAVIVNSLLAERHFAMEIQDFWSNKLHRNNSTWVDHGDINSVMLATSLAPEGYLQV